MTFMNPVLVKELIAKVDTVLKEIMNADNYQDSIHLNSPMHLFLEQPGLTRKHNK